jgi:hypothetical protein
MKREIGQIYVVEKPFPGLVFCSKLSTISIYHDKEVGGFVAILPKKDQPSEGWQIPWEKVRDLSDLNSTEQRFFIRRVFNI